jgi:hypothetical protein
LVDVTIGMVGTVDTVERVLEHGKFRAYVSNLLIDYPKVELIIRNDASFNLSKAGIGTLFFNIFVILPYTFDNINECPLW